MCLEIYGGAINDYPIDLNAFIHRGSAFSAFLDVFWYDESEHPAAELFLTKWCNVMNAFWNGEIYQNYPSLAVPDYRKSYWGKALPALVATKQKYDPHGLFNFAQMVSPEPKAPLGQEIWPPAVAAALQQPIVTDPGGSLPASGRAGGAARNAAA
jgi:hypothetical protein